MRRPTLIAAIALGLALALSAGALLHEARRPAQDFATRYAGGVAVARGDDPYRVSVVAPIERRLLGYDFSYPFRDPPPVAYGFRAISALPYHLAERLWLGVLLLAALASVRLACRLAGVAVHGACAWALLVAVALNFAPLRDGLSRLQIDPLMGMLVLLSTVAARAPGSGLLQAVASLKPQAAMLGSAGGIARGRVRFALELVAGLAALFAVTELAGGPSWSRWTDAVRSASRATGPGSYAAAAAFAVAACVLAIRAWRIRGEDRGLWALAIAACVNGAVAPLVFLNSQSDVLMLVPLLLLATMSLPRPQQIAFAGAAGIFAVSGLFAVTYHSGVAHALVPLAIAALIGIAIAVAYPARRLMVLIAVAVNVAVTLPPLPPRAYDWLGAAGSLAVLMLLGVRRQAAGSESGRPVRP